MEETGPRRSRPALGRRPLFFLIPVMSRSLYLAPSEESRPAHSLRPTWLQSVGPPSPLRPVCAHHTSRPAKIPSPPGTPAHRHSLQTISFPSSIPPATFPLAGRGGAGRNMSILAAIPGVMISLRECPQSPANEKPSLPLPRHLHTEKALRGRHL